MNEGQRKRRTGFEEIIDKYRREIGEEQVEEEDELILKARRLGKERKELEDEQQKDQRLKWNAEKRILRRKKKIEEKYNEINSFLEETFQPQNITREKKERLLEELEGKSESTDMSTDE